MKNFLAGILPVFLFLMLCAGCGTQKNTVTVARLGYSCNFETEYNGLLLTGTATVQEKQALTLKVQSPQTVAGICFEYEPNGAKLVFNKKEVSSQNNKQLKTVAAALGEVMSRLNAQSEIQAVDGVYVQEGSMSGTAYRLIFNENGFVQQFEVPARGLRVCFSNWQYS